MTDVWTDTSYAGDIGSWPAWDMLTDHAQAVLVDVRTREEWELVGRPDLGMLDKEPLFVSWQLAPDMRRNPDFAAAIEGRVPRDAPVLLLCRSGQRSREAATALAGLGYTACYNVADGWQALGLPWSHD
jgi:rhodanese-related sulfurtransferase